MTYYKLFDSLQEAQQVIKPFTSHQVEAGGRLVCLVRTEHEFHAVADACPHLGASLSKGSVNEWGEVICPWHSYRYHVTSGEECRKRGAELAIFECKIDETGLYIGLP